MSKRKSNVLIDPTDAENRTEVFLRRLPYDLTEAQLLEKGTSAGEVKYSHILLDAEGNSRGIGFVKFFKAYDAQYFVEWANNARWSEKGPRIVAQLADSELVKKGKLEEKKGGCKDELTSLVFTNLPKKIRTADALQKWILEIFQFAGIREILEGTDSWVVRLKSMKNALRLLKLVQDSETQISCTLKTPKVQNNRLILRNLDFHVTERELRKALDSFGPIQYLMIPPVTKESMANPGYAFVELESEEQASKLKAADLSIRGRPISAAPSMRREDYQKLKSADKNSLFTELPENPDPKKQKREERRQERMKLSLGLDPSQEISPGNGTPRVSDVNEGRTLFIRNIPFGASDEDVLYLFKKFGPILFLKRVLRDGVFGGSAFLKFKERVDCEKALSNKNAFFKIGDRDLVVLPALEKGTEPEKAILKSQPKESLEQSQENLLKLEFIDPKSKEAESWTKTERKQRETAVAEKMGKLKTPNYFLNPNRLLIRNVPKKHLSEDMIRKAIFKFFLKNFDAFVQATGVETPPTTTLQKKVLFNKEIKSVRLVNAEKEIKPFVFVEFVHFECARDLLKAWNNQRVLSGALSRMVIEFACEDKKKLHIQQQKSEFLQRKRLEKEKAKVYTELNSVTPADAGRLKALTRKRDLLEKNILPKERKPKADKKMGRGARQRENRRKLLAASSSS